MPLVEPQLIRELSDVDRLCFSCQVPGGCDEEHHLCLRRRVKRKRNNKSPERTEQRQKRKQQIVEYLKLKSEPVKAKEITTRFDWGSTETAQLMIDLKRAKVVRQIKHGLGSSWELK